MKRKQRAILLITNMFMAMVIMMFVGAAISLAPTSLRHSAFEARQQSADRAAQTGLAWAQAQLRTTPDWNGSAVNSTTRPDYLVTESDGQVVGWVREGSGWARFRLRFNWQDGPAASSQDGLNDPAQGWADLTLVSFNNLRQTTPRPIPQANGAGGSVTGSSPMRLTLPEHSALLSVEGSSGSAVLDGAGKPTGFSGNPTRQTLEVVLRLNGPNQAVTPAAIMAAGDIRVKLLNAAAGKLDLAATSTQVTRLRSKGALAVEQGGSPNVSSSKGELSANHMSNITTNGVSGGVTAAVETSGDGFYSIPYADVKAPTSPGTPSAGVYVVNSSGALTHYSMNYTDYLAAKSAGSLTGGTSASLPGVTVSTAATSPKVRMLATQDLEVTPVGTVTDFVVVPDGGAPATNNTYDHTQATANIQNYFNNHNQAWLGSLNGYTVFNAWYSIFPNLPGVTQSGSTYQWTAPNGGVVRLHSSSDSWSSSSWDSTSAMALAGAMASTFAPGQPNAAQALTDYNVLAAQTGAPPYTPAPALPAPGELTPSELELKMEGSAGGSLVIKNEGNLVFGSQIQGNGASLVSGADIQLLGSSTQLSSTPGVALGLNLYAKGDILISTFKLDSTGAATFNKVDLKGVVYGWGNVTINVGDSTVPQSSWGDMALKGALVAFGGDPSSPVPVYAGGTSGGQFNFSGKSATVQFDPSYLMGLYENLPSPLSFQIVSWHQR